MAISGYFLYGLDGERLLVVRSWDDEAMLKVIKRIQASRDKEIKALGAELEEHFNDKRDGNISKPRPKNTKKNTTSTRVRTRKTANPKRRS